MEEEPKLCNEFVLCALHFTTPPHLAEVPKLANINRVNTNGPNSNNADIFGANSPILSITMPLTPHD